MTATLRPVFGGCRLFGSALLVLVLSACESDHPSRDSARRHQPPPPPLAGQETFFDGRITAELKTGAGFGDSGKPDENAPTGGGRRGGGGGMRMGGGGRHGGGGGGGGRGYGSNEPSVSDTIEQDQISNIRRAAANGGPPVYIHLRFTNNGTQHADLIVADFLSELGNFVVEPEKLALEPGQSLEVEPMTSRLAEMAQAEVTLTLRLDGKNEKKTIALAPIPTPPPAAPDTPPAAPPPSK